MFPFVSERENQSFARAWCLIIRSRDKHSILSPQKFLRRTSISKDYIYDVCAYVIFAMPGETLALGYMQWVGCK